MTDPFLNRLNNLFLGKVPGKSGARGNGRFAVATSVGLVRPHNEDRCAVIKARFGGASSRDFNLGIVCDGLGGMASGQEAAVLGLSTFVASLLRGARPSALHRLNDAISAANDRIHDFLRGRGGTTLTAALVTRHHGAYLCHVGDSRLFAIGPDRTLHQLTRDDTLAALLQKPGPGGRRDSRLLQFVGMGDEIEPQVAPIDLKSPTSYLLTTDGAHDLPGNVLERVVGAASGPLDLARKLVQLSDMLGGIDNSSVVMLPTRLEDEHSQPDGTELTVVTPAEEITIWLPSVKGLQDQPDFGKDDRVDHARGGNPSERDAVEKTPAGGKAKKSAAAPKARKRKAARKKASESELPLGEKGAQDVNVEFPEAKREEG